MRLKRLGLWSALLAATSGLVLTIGTCTAMQDAVDVLHEENNALTVHILKLISAPIDFLPPIHDPDWME